MKRIMSMLVTLALLCCFTGTRNVACAQTQGGARMITITSTAFSDGNMIPKEYTCDGSNISPALSWSNVPEGTKSLALVCDDPDAPMGTWIHWVLFNIPPTTRELQRGMPSEKTLADGAKHGINDFRKYGYGGPCPPGGTHRYYFKIYALDTELTMAPGISKEALLTAMQGHILAEGRLMGTYKR